jgi:ATP-dependent DNA helicase RecQ
VARGKKQEKARGEAVSWEGVDVELFEALRRLRKQLAEERKVPPYIIFTDATLRHMARLRPTTPEALRLVSGVGEAKLRDFGERFLEAVRAHGGVAPAAPAAKEKPRLAPAEERARAFALFRQGAPVEQVMEDLGQGRSHVMNYLDDYVRAERPRSLAPWVPDDVYQRIAAAARRFGTGRLQPITLALGEQFPSETIRLVLAHLKH